MSMRSGRSGGGAPSRREFLRRSVQMGAAAGLVGGLASPGRSYGAVGGGHGGNLAAVTKQLYGTGLFIGNEFQGWSDATRQGVFHTIAGWGFDFVCPKVGGYGSTWYSSDQQLQNWRNWAHSDGLGFVPFIYSVPSSSTRDAQICSEIGDDCGIVVVDMEDEYQNSASAMANFGAVFRKTNPNTPIIVSGYGDPVTRFGGTWPYPQMTYWADAYGPQWYYGEWSEYANYGVEPAINWADSQCGQVCGSNFPMSPELSIYTIYQNSGILPYDDIMTGELYSKDWKAPIFWWEYGNMNSTIAYYCLGK